MALWSRSCCEASSAAGKEPLPTLEKLAGQYGYNFEKFAVAPPGVEQKSVWLRVGRQRLDHGGAVRV